jgi:hypothetical protein
LIRQDIFSDHMEKFYFGCMNWNETMGNETGWVIPPSDHRKIVIDFEMRNPMPFLFKMLQRDLQRKNRAVEECVAL